MPYTRRQKAKARNSREMNMMSDFDNLDIMKGNENINAIERELANTIGESTAQFDIESNPHPREISPLGDEFRNFNINKGNNTPRQDGILESIETFTNEFNMRLSQKMDSILSMMHTRNNRAIRSQKYAIL